MEQEKIVLIGLGIAAAAKYCMLSSLYKNTPKQAKKVGTVSAITIFPLKSGTGISLDEAACTFHGLQCGKIKDRTWMVVYGDENRFVTGRQEPRLTLIKPTVDGDELVLKAPGLSTLRLPITIPESSIREIVKVWGEALEATTCGEKAAAWISRFLGKPGHKIVAHTDGWMKRKCIEGDTRWHKMSKVEDQVSFADGFPYMLMSEATVGDLNSRLKNPVSINNFRPNIIAVDCGAFDEDSWNNIYIGEAKFTNIKPCQRCIFTTVDPEKGEKDPDTEPLKTLKSYRLLNEEFGNYPCFGINLIVDRPGTIKVGDEIMVL